MGFSVTNPLESQSPTNFYYPGTNNQDYQGTINKPLVVTRSLGNPVVSATIGGTVTAGDQIFMGAESQATVTYTVQPGDTTTSIAASLASLINADTGLQNLTVVATAVGASVTLHSDLIHIYSYVGAGNSGATETVTFLSPSRQSAVGTLSGTLTVGDRLFIFMGTPWPQSGNSRQYFHTVTAGDTYDSVIADFAAQINADSALQSFKGSATALGSVINFFSYNPIRQYWELGIWSGAGTESWLMSHLRKSDVQTNEYE